MSPAPLRKEMNTYCACRRVLRKKILQLITNKFHTPPRGGVHHDNNLCHNCQVLKCQLYSIVKPITGGSSCVVKILS